MTSNKLIDILKTLTKDEKLAFIQFLKDRLLPKLEIAVKISFSLIEKKQFNSANYYAKCYAKKYDKKKDYLIRNDFRRILSVFKVFIKNIPTKDSENEILYLNFLIKKGLHQQVESFYQSSILTAEKTHDYASQFQFIEAYIKYTEQQELSSSNKFKALIDLNEKKKVLLIDNFSKQFRETELTNVYLKRNYQAYFPDYKIELVDEKLTISTSKNDYEKYLYLKSKNYLINGHEKIEGIKKCINFLIKNETELNKQVSVENEKISLTATIALENFLMNDFKNSYTIYTELIEAFNSKSIHSPNKYSILFNFITTCLKVGKYKVATLTIENNLQELSLIPAYTLKITCILNMCYLMTNQEKKISINQLEELLKKPIELSEKIYVRIIIALYYFSINKKDLAEIEIQNSYQFIRHHDKLANYKDLILVLKKVLENTLDNSSKLTQKIKTLKADFGNAQINLPIIWMENYLNNLQ